MKARNESIRCNFCDSPATATVGIVDHGQFSEIRFCDLHRSDWRYTAPGPPESHVDSTASKRSELAMKSCPSCGTSFEKFVNDGIVGCPQCLDEFEEVVAETMGTDADKERVAFQRNIRKLREKLAAAIDDADFERAGEIADILRAFEGGKTEEKKEE